MGIPFEKIEELITICKKVDAKVYEDDWDKRIHVRDIQATLQKLIDDEMEHLDKMAEQFQQEEEEAKEVSLQYIRAREALNRSDWPHGL